MNKIPALMMNGVPVEFTEALKRMMGVIETPAWCKVEGCDKWTKHVKGGDRHDMGFYDMTCELCPNSHGNEQKKMLKLQAKIRQKEDEIESLRLNVSELNTEINSLKIDNQRLRNLISEKVADELKGEKI